MRSSSRTVPGTGLSILPYALLITFSVALFLFWGGPLWKADREASHVGRFAFSYLLVIPAAAALLALARRFTWSHLVAATCSAWGIKLVITSALYFTLARGTAHTPVAALPTASSKAPAGATTDYRAAKQAFASGVIRGDIATGGHAMGGAIVVIDKPLPGRPLSDEAPALRIKIGGGSYDRPIYLGRTDSELSIESGDGALHTFHLYLGDRAVLNIPVTADGKPHKASAPEAGVYSARCDTHENERAMVVIVDHPYTTRTGPDGAFAIEEAPVGPLTLMVIAPAGDQAPKTAGKEASVSLMRRVSAKVEASETTVIHIDLSTPEVAEERL